MWRLRIPFVATVTALLSLIALPASASDDAHFSKQWSLRKIGAPAAWARPPAPASASASSTPASTSTHEDLAGKVVESTSCVGSEGDPAKCNGSAQDDQGHGTHVAGIAAAIKDNGIGVAGVAPDAQLVVAKVLERRRRRHREDVNAGIKWVVDHGAKVVNLSLGDPNFVVTASFGSRADARASSTPGRTGAIPVVASGNSDLLRPRHRQLELRRHERRHRRRHRPRRHRWPATRARPATPSGPSSPPAGPARQPEADDIYSTFWSEGKNNLRRTWPARRWPPPT